GPEGLQYVGHVGTGFTEAVLRQLGELLAPLARPTSPFATGLPRDHARGARWTEPRLVGEVAYGQLTLDGMLRHAAWRGLRPDKARPAGAREPPPCPERGWTRPARQGQAAPTRCTGCQGGMSSSAASRSHRWICAPSLRLNSASTGRPRQSPRTLAVSGPP